MTFEEIVKEQQKFTDALIASISEVIAGVMIDGRAAASALEEKGLVTESEIKAQRAALLARIGAQTSLEIAVEIRAKTARRMGVSPSTPQPN